MVALDSLLYEVARVRPLSHNHMFVFSGLLWVPMCPTCLCMSKPFATFPILRRSICSLMNEEFTVFQTENLQQEYMSKPPPPKCACPQPHPPRLSGGCSGGLPSTGCAGCLPHTTASAVAPSALCHLLIGSSCGLCFCMASEGELVQSLTWEYSHKQFTSSQKR